MYIAVLSLLTIVTSISSISCGYPEYKENHLYVHLIPHSHDDVGWVKTAYEYYFGVDDNYAEGNYISIREIITNVIEELTMVPERKFT